MAAYKLWRFLRWPIATTLHQYQASCVNPVFVKTWRAVTKVGIRSLTRDLNMRLGTSIHDNADHKAMFSCRLQTNLKITPHWGKDLVAWMKIRIRTHNALGLSQFQKLHKSSTSDLCWEQPTCLKVALSIKYLVFAARVNVGPLKGPFSHLSSSVKCTLVCQTKLRTICLNL